MILTLCALAASCGKAPEGPAEPAAPLPQIRVGHVGHDHQIALYVSALNPGMTRDRCGVWLSEKKPREVYDLMDGDRPLAELHLMKVRGASNMPAAMEKGELDVGLGGIAAVVFFIDKGAPVRILTPLNVDGDMLVVRPDFPARDFDGFVKAVRASDGPVRIGYKGPVAVALLVFKGACDAIGLPYGEEAKAGAIQLVNLREEEQTVPSLEKGLVDGVVINEPFGSMAVVKNVGRVVAPLADLPPEGRWKAHPCCVICASERAVAEHRAALVALLRMTGVATEWIRSDRGKAAELASAWTGADLAVERLSVPGIEYLHEANDVYRRGFAIWFDIMRGLGQFKGRLKDLDAGAAFAACHDLTLLEEASKPR
jgi:NitT/TauT family transport system substrate-binding protein